MYVHLTYKYNLKKETCIDCFWLCSFNAFYSMTKHDGLVSDQLSAKGAVSIAMNFPSVSVSLQVHPVPHLQPKVDRPTCRAVMPIVSVTITAYLLRSIELEINSNISSTNEE